MIIYCAVPMFQCLYIAESLVCKVLQCEKDPLGLPNSQNLTPYVKKVEHWNKPLKSMTYVFKVGTESGTEVEQVKAFFTFTYFICKRLLDISLKPFVFKEFAITKPFDTCSLIKKGQISLPPTRYSVGFTS